MRLHGAIIRPPGASFAAGLTTAGLGPPDLALARDQHAAYAAALERCGLAVHRLDPDDAHPDSTFVEDTAILTPRGAVLTRPGAPSRRGEIAAIRPAVEAALGPAAEIVAPGTLDGGDVCEIEGRWLIGRSERTNDAGARRLAAILEAWGYEAAIVDLRGAGLLHLKSGMASIGGGVVVADRALAGHEVLRGYDRVEVADEERYAANCVRVNDAVLIADGFPGLRSALERRGIPVIPLAMSEFRKMDGGLSCLSLRYGAAVRPTRSGRG